MRSLALIVILVVAACDDDAEVKACMPENACTCMDGMERDTACVCAGGATCSVEGDNIEFSCDGNAACNLTCGTNCLITCPGTTACTVDVGDDAVVTCPGTASCDVLCHGDCEVSVAGNADAVVRCEKEAEGATCNLMCGSPMSCGNGVHTCGRACP